MKHRWVNFLVVGACVVVAAVMIMLVETSSYLTPRSDQTLLRPNDTQLTALGEEVYKANCASCHGANLEGEPNWRRSNPDLTMPAPPHDQTGHTWHHDDETLFKLTKFGVASFVKNKSYKSNMPAYENVLEDGEVIAVLSYIKSRWPADVQQRHDQLNQNSGRR